MSLGLDWCYSFLLNLFLLNECLWNYILFKNTFQFVMLCLKYRFIFFHKLWNQHFLTKGFSHHQKTTFLCLWLLLLSRLFWSFSQWNLKFLGYITLDESLSYLGDFSSQFLIFVYHPVVLYSFPLDSDVYFYILLLLLLFLFFFEEEDHVQKNMFFCMFFSEVLVLIGIIFFPLQCHGGVGYFLIFEWTSVHPCSIWLPFESFIDLEGKISKPIFSV